MKNFLIIFILLFVTSCATSPTGRSQLMLISPEQAIVASKEAYIKTLQPLDEQGKVDSNAIESERVREITGRLIAQAIILFPHTKAWEWSVKVIDAPETINAWCMAGGKMAIYTGLINKIKATDDEIAQVMGHEISHALANHSAERMSRAMATQLGLMGIAVASAGVGYSGAIVDGSSAAAKLALTLPNSRTSEIEADRMGIEIAALAGYDPRAAAGLWQKMAEAGGNGPPEFLSTHPAPGNRQETLAALADQMMPYYLDRSERPIYRLK